MKKVIIIAADFYPNSTGFANATINLVNLIKNDYDVTVFTDVALGDGKEFEGAHIERYKCGKFRRHMSVYKSMCNYIEKNGADIILLETNTFSYLQNKLLKKYGDKVAVRIHSTVDAEVLAYRKSLLGRIYHYPDIQFMRKVRYVIATNSYHVCFVKNMFLMNNIYDMWQNKQYFILPNLSDIEFSGERSVSNTDYYLTLGKMNKGGIVQKGIQDVLMALYIQKKEARLKTKFIIIGDGEYKEALSNYADKLGVSEYVDFVGGVSHQSVQNYLSECKAVVLPSRYEGQSMFITEAIAMGCPLIITNDNGMEDLIVDNVNGYVVKTGDSEDLALKISMFDELSASEIAEMSKQSYDIYRTRFAPEVVKSKFDMVFDCVCNSVKF